MQNKSTIALRAASLVAFAAVLLAIAGCSGKSGPQAPPPPEVSVIKTVVQAVPVYEEYVGQTEAVDTVEIRARVSGILERVRPLLADEAISQQDLDAAVAREAADAANVDAAKAQVKTAELNLDYATIRAPRDGVISKALIKPGGLVNASTTLLTTLYSDGQIYVNFALSEQKLLKLQRELKHNPGEEKSKLPPFHLKLVDGSEYQSSGKLNFVDAAVDPKSGTVQIRLLVPNPDRLLRAGQLVRVIFPSLEPLQAIRIPQRAVQELQGKRSVYVVDAEGKAAYREITATTRVGNDWVVESGLKAGEMVIVDGTQKVRPGAPVKPVVETPEANGGAKQDAAKPAPAGSAH